MFIYHTHTTMEHSINEKVELLKRQDIGGNVIDVWEFKSIYFL